MSDDLEQRHVAMPKLVGAPAYSTPPRTYAPSPRPLDPDDLPLESLRTEGERVLAEQLRQGNGAAPVSGTEPPDRRRAGTLRRLTSRWPKSA